MLGLNLLVFLTIMVVHNMIVIECQIFLNKFNNSLKIINIFPYLIKNSKWPPPYDVTIC